MGSLYLLVLFPLFSSPGSFLQGQGHGVSPAPVAFFIFFPFLPFLLAFDGRITFECRAEGVASRDRLRSRNGMKFYFMILGYQYRIFNSSLCAAFLSLIKVEPFFIAIDSNSVQCDLLALRHTCHSISDPQRCPKDFRLPGFKYQAGDTHNGPYLGGRN